MKSQKHIWILNYYSTPPELASNERHLRLTHYLQDYGYKVTLFSSDFFIKKDDTFSIDGNYVQASYGEYKFNHIKVSKYKGNGLRRMFSIFQFSWRVYKYRNKFEKPDIILHNFHAPFDFFICCCAKKLKVRYIAEAWDLWPEDFVTFGLISKRNPLLKLSYSIERMIYEKADIVIYTFEGGLAYLREKRWTDKTGGKVKENKVHYINNGISLEDFNMNIELFKFTDDDLMAPNIYKIVYMGSINYVNDLKQLIDAVSLLKEYDNIRLFIFGDGDYRASLMDYCTSKNISNVVFKDKWVPLKYVPFILSNASLNILNYMKGFGNYGISSGKLFQYLAAGKPIICNIPIHYDDVITNNNLGIADNLDTSEKYAEAILKIYKMSIGDYISMSARVLETAKQFDYKILTQKLINIIENE